MKIELSDATCARIQKLYESDAYRSFEEVITTGLALIEDRDKHDPLDDFDENEIAEIREQVQRVAAQADRGETIPAEVVLARLEKRYTEMLKQEKLKQKE